MAAETPTVAFTATSGTDNVAGRHIRQVRTHLIETANTVDAADTFTFDLATVGGTTLLAVNGCVHTTDDSVVAAENPTTSVSSGVITFTVIAGTDNDKRIAKIWYT